ncbi:unnamed protein product [Candidula unifasciata]|uniref:Receptor ligand binding region domain-containing protein n=1 Tax=Candidula unifasciata TaxID=100452 RepID=A0A8S3YHQ6_9EUPU|nr:unnamed protein product [Candidula unifasciata]
MLKTYSLLPWIIMIICIINIVCGDVSSSPSSSSPPDRGNSACEPSAVKRHLENKIRIGVILPFSGDYPYRIQLTRPAVEYARDYILQKTNLLQNYSIEFDYRDSKCSDVTAPLEAIDMYIKKSVDLFLGPACEYAIAVVARFTRTWGIPLISAGAQPMAFADKNIYGLLTRMVSTVSYDKFAKVFTSILTHYGYKNVGMLYQSNENPSDGKSECWFIMEAVFTEVQKVLNPQVDKQHVEEFFESNNSRSEFTKRLKNLSATTRGKPCFMYL